MWLIRIINYLRGYRRPDPRKLVIEDMKPLLQHFKDAQLMFETSHTWDSDDLELAEAKEMLDWGIKQMEGYIKQGGYIINSN